MPVYFDSLGFFLSRLSEKCCALLPFGVLLFLYISFCLTFLYCHSGVSPCTYSTPSLTILLLLQDVFLDLFSCLFPFCVHHTVCLQGHSGGPALPFSFFPFLSEPFLHRSAKLTCNVPGDSSMQLTASLVLLSCAPRPFLGLHDGLHSRPTLRCYFSSFKSTHSCSLHGAPLLLSIAISAHFHSHLEKPLLVSTSLLCLRQHSGAISRSPCRFLRLTLLGLVCGSSRTVLGLRLPLAVPACHHSTSRSHLLC